ncbi:Ig-like domain-containing domain [Ferruginibacter profundus]
MKVSHFLNVLLIITLGGLVIVGNSGCGQIGAISGGLKDTLPPALLTASPKLLSTNITDNKITLTFDEYIDELQEVQANVLVSPYPKSAPEFKSKLKTVSIKLKDTLLPNTTYSINFGNAIRDVNEGNVLKNFTYVFSTGNTIDSLRLTGKVELAETGKPDSTMIVMLYRNANDSSVQQIKPAYIAFLKGDGSFTFNNLPPGNFNIYALKDGDGGKTYNSKTEQFAFADGPITVTENNKPIALFAYAEEKMNKTPVTTTTVKPKTAAQKKLKYTLGSGGQKQDLRGNLVLDFNNAIKKLDTTKITLTDTNFVAVPGVSYLVDSNKVILKTKWLEDADYKIVIQKNAVRDSTDSTITKTDTIRIKTMGPADYGNVVLRFKNIILTKHPVLQFVQDDIVKESFPVTASEWSNKLFPPGEYEIRILYDDNNNGKWDPGSYTKKLQPEKVIALPKKFAVKANWDNESDINL